MRIDDPVAAFIEASVWDGSLDRAEEILASHPEVANRNIYTAAIVGDDDAVRRFLAIDANNATAPGGPFHWDALTHLCFSKYLRLDRARSERFVRAATALLDAGASANTGYFDASHQPHPQLETVLYGVAGVAHHAPMTRLLLERGADPNDGETPYHAPETYDNEALKLLVESGKLTGESLTTMLLRKADWHDLDGIRWLLDRGADPNQMTHWGFTAFQQALRRDNSLAIIEAMLDHGADPTIANQHNGQSGVELAARQGRGDVLDLFMKRGVTVELVPVARLLAACACHDVASVRSFAEHPEIIRDLLAEGGKVLVAFAGVGNTEGVRLLLELGFAVDILFEEGDGYWEVAKKSTALHVAAWRARHATVRLLIERGAAIDRPDGSGRTPLARAVSACVDSYWRDRRSPESVEMLLRAGASPRGISIPTGYGEVDELLKRYRAGGNTSDTKIVS